MSNKGRPIQHIEQNKSDPTFEVRRLKTAGFASEHDAESWIKDKSAGWLQNRATALRP